MYQLDANNFTMILASTCFGHLHVHLQEFLYRLFHRRMWCYAIGVEAVVLRSWCVVLCTVCQLVSNWPFMR